MLTGIVDANAEDEKLIKFAIPISQSLAAVLEERATSGRASVKESLEYAGISFYTGSQIGIDNENRTMYGKLAYTEACLVMELSRMFLNFPPEAVRRYFDNPGEIRCFPEQAAEQAGADQPATAPESESESQGKEKPKTESEVRPQ
jgi:hypothetical protein